MKNYVYTDGVFPKLTMTMLKNMFGEAHIFVSEAIRGTGNCKICRIGYLRDMNGNSARVHITDTFISERPCVLITTISMNIPDKFFIKLSDAKPLSAQLKAAYKKRRE